MQQGICGHPQKQPTTKRRKTQIETVNMTTVTTIVGALVMPIQKSRKQLVLKQLLLLLYLDTMLSMQNVKSVIKMLVLSAGFNLIRDTLRFR